MQINDKRVYLIFFLLTKGTRVNNKQKLMLT